MMFTYDKSEYRDELLWFQQEAKYDPERAKAHLCNDCREVLRRDGTEFCDDCLDRLRVSYAEDWYWAAYRAAA